MATRLTARVIYSPETPKTKHYRGLSPQVSGGVEVRQPMDSPAVLLIEQKPDGIFLFRFTAESHCVGDTWHESIGAAKEQASFEFNDLITEWKEVPAEVSDSVSFGLAADP